MHTQEQAARFRNALSAFATGVAIVTIRTADGSYAGLTVNSFNSVSLDPPLVSWSLRLASAKLMLVRNAGRFAINVLASSQRDLSRRFATPSAGNQFDGVDLEFGRGGLPLLTGCIARFQCDTEVSYVLGDHELFVGRVMEFERFGHEMTPLIFCSGTYLVPGLVSSGVGLG